MILEFKSLFPFWVCFEKLKSDYNKINVKDAVGVASYIYKVRSHVDLFLCELLWYWISSRLAANYKQILYLNATCEPLSWWVGGA